MCVCVCVCVCVCRCATLETYKHFQDSIAVNYENVFVRLL